jgi:hypothetical protein
MIPKEKYRILCEAEPIPLFSQAWWLDAVCGEAGWDVCLIESGGIVVASMPYHVKSKLGFKVLSHPPLTQSLGPWFRPIDAKPSKRLSAEKELMEGLIKQLPPHHFFQQNWHHSRTNWLPFYWEGFSQTTRYTYILHDISDAVLLWKGLQDSTRREIKKARDRFHLKVTDELGIEDFLELNRLTFARQNLPLPYSVDLIRRVDEACVRRQSRKIWIAVDPEGRHHAACYIVWASGTAYYLMGGGDSELRASGASSLCMWTAIENAATVAANFDFEGSMIEPIERFVRSFGAVQQPYHRVSRANSRLIRVGLGLKQAMGR